MQFSMELSFGTEILLIVTISTLKWLLSIQHIDRSSKLTCKFFESSIQVEPKPNIDWKKDKHQVTYIMLSSYAFLPS